MVQYIDMERAYEIIQRLGRINNGGITVLNKGQLEMALGRPKTALFGHEQYPELYQKAAILMEVLTKAHCLSDGNKRFAMLAAERMVELNGSTLVMPLKAIRLSVDTAMDSEDVMRDEIQLWFKTHMARNDTELSVMLEERMGEEYTIDKLASEGKIKDAESLIELWLAFDSHPEYKKEWDDLVGHWETEKKYKYGWQGIITNVFDSHIENPALYKNLIKIAKEQDSNLVGHTLSEMATREKNIASLVERIGNAGSSEYRHRCIDVLMCFRRYNAAQRCCQKMLREHPHDPDAITKMARIYYESGEYVKCMRFVKESLDGSTPAERATLRYLEAQSHIGLKDPDGAKKICDEEIRGGNTLRFTQLKCRIEKQALTESMEKKLYALVGQAIPPTDLASLLKPTAHDADTVAQAISSLKDKQTLVDIIRIHDMLERHDDANALRGHLRRTMFH